MSNQIVNNQKKPLMESPWQMFCNFFKSRRIQSILLFTSFVILFVIVSLVKLPLKDFHVFAHLLIYFAILFNLIYTLIPLWDLKHGSKKAHHAFLILVIIYWALVFVYPLGFIIIFILKLNKMELASNIIAIAINFLFIICGILIFRGDTLEGEKKNEHKKLAWQLDLPFIIAIVYIFLFTLALFLFKGNSMNEYSLGIGSGGLAFHLILANMIAPGGKFDCPYSIDEKIIKEEQ